MFCCFECHRDPEFVIRAAMDCVTHVETEAAPAYPGLAGSMRWHCQNRPYVSPCLLSWHSPAWPGPLWHGEILVPKGLERLPFLRPQICLFGQPQTGSGWSLLPPQYTCLWCYSVCEILCLLILCQGWDSRSPKYCFPSSQKASRSPSAWMTGGFLSVSLSVFPLKCKYSRES